MLAAAPAKKVTPNLSTGCARLLVELSTVLYTVTASRGKLCGKPVDKRGKMPSVTGNGDKLSTLTSLEVEKASVYPLIALKTALGAHLVLTVT